jgi:hypothetical protein
MNLEPHRLSRRYSHNGVEGNQGMRIVMYCRVRQAPPNPIPAGRDPSWDTPPSVRVKFFLNN